MKLLLTINCLFFTTITQLISQQNISPLYSGKYFGEPLPETIPVVFAEGIVSSEKKVYANITFHPEFTEACWTPNTSVTNYHGGIITTKYLDGKWSTPEEINFMGAEYSHRSPFYDYCGKRLYFQAHLKSDQGWDQKEKFYFVEQTVTGWSKPMLLDTIFNKYSVHWQFSLDKKNNMYFGGELRGIENSGGIYFSKHLNGKYKEPILVFKNEELGGAVLGPAISPNNDYLLFARIHPRGSTNPRIFSIYASFLSEENVWSEPLELGEKLNMDGNQPRISPDGKFIFFVGNDGLPYWISAKFLDELK